MGGKITGEKIFSQYAGNFILEKAPGYEKIQKYRQCY